MTLYETFDGVNGFKLDERECATEAEYVAYCREMAERFGDCYTVAVDDQATEDNAAYNSIVAAGLARHMR